MYGIGMWNIYWELSVSASINNRWVLYVHLTSWGKKRIFCRETNKGQINQFFPDSSLLHPTSCFRSKGSHCHRKAQLDEHGQTEHQRPDRVRSQPGTHARLRLCTAAAVLCRDGTLPQARLEKYVMPCVWTNVVDVGLRICAMSAEGRREACVYNLALIHRSADPSSSDSIHPNKPCLFPLVSQEDLPGPEQVLLGGFGACGEADAWSRRDNGQCQGPPGPQVSLIRQIVSRFFPKLWL